MKNAFLAALLGASMLFSMPAKGAWLQACPGANADASGPVAQILKPDGSSLQAFVNEKPAAPPCEQTKLDVSAHSIRALQPITPAMAAHLGPALTLSAKAEGEQLVISEITPAQPATSQPSAALPLPLGHNLLTSLQVTPFGAENRVEVSAKDDQLRMQCHPGQQPAGVILGADFYMARARSRLQLRGSGSGDFKVITANAAQAASGSGLVLGLFQAQAVESTQSYDIEPVTSRAGWRHWTLACPMQSARLQLDNLQLMPLAGALPPRALWVWQASQWQSQAEAVFKLAQRYSVSTLYITIPQNAGSVLKPRQLMAFIQHAAKAGLSVWAVDGDPNMVQPKERAATLERARAYARFNEAAPANAGLQGVQFDVEPYLLPGYDLAAQSWEEHYIQLVKALHSSLDEGTAPMALEMVVPFWWAHKQDLLDKLVPWVNSLAVMDYRTDPKEIYRFAVPFLDWGEQHRKAVRIALEAGPIALETRYRYEKAPAGELWLVQLGQQPFLLVLKHLQHNTQGAAFKLSSTFETKPSATTFNGDSASLLRQLPELEAVFSAWAGFAGLALHEIR